MQNKIAYNIIENLYKKAALFSNPHDHQHSLGNCKFCDNNNQSLTNEICNDCFNNHVGPYYV